MGTPAFIPAGGAQDLVLVGQEQRRTTEVDEPLLVLEEGGAGGLPFGRRRRFDQGGGVAEPELGHTVVGLGPTPGGPEEVRLGRWPGVGPGGASAISL